MGTIVKIDKHPNADSLYLEEIDLGEDKPRQVEANRRSWRHAGCVGSSLWIEAIYLDSPVVR